MTTITLKSLGRRLAVVLTATVLLGSVGLVSSPATSASAATPAASKRAVPSPTATEPGPPVLHSPAPRAPQLENAQEEFAAPFDRTSGTERYVDGEYLYTDYIYDDLDGPASYPDDYERYDNVADLVEFRISTRTPGVTAFRVTLNSLRTTDSTLSVLALDTDRDPDTGSASLPMDAGAPFPGTDAVFATWGTGASWSAWDGSTWQTTDLSASADLERNQLVSVVPNDVLDASLNHDSVRMTLAVGLFDPETHGFLDTGDPRIFNLGFRFDEFTGDGTGLLTGGPAAEQTAALKDHEPTRYAHELDLVALRSGARRTTVPTHGRMVRFFPSRLELGEGYPADSSKIDDLLTAKPQTHGQLQPYTLYVPSSYQIGAPAPLTLNLHALGTRYWLYMSTSSDQAFGEERDNLVLTPDARGTGGWYTNEAEFDVFEAWNDVARFFTLDPERTTITGYSMGGQGTYRLALLYPDLFARAAPVVGPPANGLWLGVGPPLPSEPESLTNLWLENARNVPFHNIVGAIDELVPITGTLMQNLGPRIPLLNVSNSFESLKYRYDFIVFPLAGHIAPALLELHVPLVKDFLGDSRREVDPRRVTLSYTPKADRADLGLVHNKAYWVSGVTLRDEDDGVGLPKVGRGVIDVTSHGQGLAEPETTVKPGVGYSRPMPYVKFSRSWEAPATEPARNVLTINLDNIGNATIDVAHAGLDPQQTITLETRSDGAARIALTVNGEPAGTFAVPKGDHSQSVDVTP